MTLYTPASSAIAAVDYDEETQTATVTFFKGGSITIEGIPEIEIQRWMSSPSVGGYWNAFLRGKY